MKQRILSIRPAVGSNSKWNKDYNKFMDQSRHISRYNDNRSKG